MAVKRIIFATEIKYILKTRLKTDRIRQDVESNKYERLTLMDVHRKEHISHLYQNGEGVWTIQSNSDHCRGVGELASQFASDFEMEEWGNLLGLLHDKGKESNAFQAYIKRVSGYDPTIRLHEKHNHAYVGGIIANILFKQQSHLLVNPIIGHHRGLYDFSDINEILKEKIPDGVACEVDSPTNVLPTPENVRSQDMNHIIRMLFSCLVDADYLDTERFMNIDSYNQRRKGYSLDSLLDSLEKHLSELNAHTKSSTVNTVRREVQQYCRGHEGEPNIYEMTVPTGGGKTLSSILWALRHAIKNGLKRIIIAIPYTSIIEQTAETLRSIFGEDNVLEHHSQVDYDNEKHDGVRQSLQLATENWNYPIVVTTNVRLFESMFSHRPGTCRRLHNLAKSVIIFDEVQTLPLPYYTVILQALDTYKRIFGCSILFTTASMPPLSGDIRGCNQFVKCVALPSKPIPIVPHDKPIWKPLKRVKIHVEPSKYSYDGIAEKISQYPRVLCIVNTRKIAQEIYNRMPKDESLIHLSRMMCPAHVKQQLQKIKQRLKDPTKKIQVISTQLIEAGVDVDFPIVFRQEAGLDSVIQAAGRCNREGKLHHLGHTYVFSLSESRSIPPGLIAKGNSARLDMSKDSDWFANDAMEDYFNRLYRKIDSFDEDNTYADLSAQRLKFETASRNFKYINDDTIPVVITWGNSDELIRDYSKYGASYRLMRQLRQYSVNISRYDYKTLLEGGLIREIGDLSVLTDPRNYHPDIGLVVNNHWVTEPLII